jgi:hypothetical protein
LFFLVGIGNKKINNRILSDLKVLIVLGREIDRNTKQCHSIIRTVIGVFKGVNGTLKKHHIRN